MNQPEHVAHHDHSLHRWLLATSLGVGALSLTPYVLPALGIGKPDAAEGLMHFIGAPATSPFGSGLAATLQSGFSQIPLLGSTLTSTTPVNFLGISMTSGALASIAVSGFLGIGGALLANWLEKREDPNAPIHWSKWIRTAALATSILIALPNILGALSIAITFLAGVMTTPSASASAINSTAMAMRDTLGATTAHAGAAGGVSSALSHLVACGIGILPVGLATYFGTNKPATSSATPRTRIEKSGIIADVSGNAPLRAGEDAVLNITLSDSAGRPLTGLQPQMGMMAHLIGISEDRQDFIHCHPLTRTVEGMQFHVHPNKPGITRFFLQLKRDGVEVVLPMDIRIAPPARFSAREAARPTHQHAMAVGL